MRKVAYYGGGAWVVFVIIIGAYSGFSLLLGGRGLIVPNGFGEVLIYAAIAAPGWYAWKWGNPHLKDKK